METENGDYCVARPDDNCVKLKNVSAEYSYVNVSFVSENERDVTTVNSDKRSYSDSINGANEIQNGSQYNIDMQSDYAILQIQGKGNMVVGNGAYQYKTENLSKASETSTADVVLTTEKFVTQLEWSPHSINSNERFPEVETHFATVETDIIYEGYPLSHGKETHSQIASADSSVINKNKTSASLDAEIIRSVDGLKETANKSSNGGVKGLFSRFCKDELYRNKVIRTFFVLWENIVIGWIFCMPGPILPDLQLLTGASLQQASWLFSGFNIGYLISCATSGFVRIKFNSDALIFIYTTGIAVSMGVLPWFPSIYGMIAAYSVTGYCCGGLDIELHPMIFDIWHSDGGVFMLMMHFLFAVGGIVSPLVNKPFMIKTVRKFEENVTTMTSKCLVNNVSQCDQLTDAGREGENYSAPATVQNNDVPTVLEQTNIHIAFITVAVLSFSAALPFLIFYIGSKTEDKERSKEPEEKENSSNLPNKVKLLTVILLCAVSAVGTALVDNIPKYLATFGILELGWSQDYGSSMTSLFFAMYAVGNLLGAFILKCITSRSFTFLTYLTSVGSVLLLLVSVQWAISAIQTVMIGAIGLTVSNILPTIFAWTQDEVTSISGKIASAFLFSGSAGGMANPVLLGFLMESLDPKWFLYLHLAEVLFCFVVYTSAALVIMIQLRRHQRATRYEIETKNGKTVVSCISDGKN